MVRYCHLVVFNLGHCVIDHVVKCWLWSILEVLCCVFFYYYYYFYHGAILGNFGGLWNFDNVGTL